MFTRSFDRRVYLFVAVLLGAGVVGTSFAVYALWPANVEVGYQPLQPIAYSHKVHAGDLQIDCRFCHHRADRDDHAGVPSIATCMKCHDEVQPKDSQGNIRPEMKKLLAYWDRKEPVQWVKVHDLADFVYFPHYRHTSWFNPKTGEREERIACQVCHGPIETMEVVQRQASLKMGWCLECHMLPPESDNSPGMERRGPINCSACHR